MVRLRARRGKAAPAAAGADGAGGTGACPEKWPVVAPVDKNDTEGIIKKGFVTFQRPDGIGQQTPGCRPIYTFAGDAKPDDTHGQGVGGTRHAMAPDSKPVGAPA